MEYDIKKLILEVLETGYLMSLGTQDDGGVWVADVSYISDDLNIYWVSHQETRHSKAILAHPQVAGTITVNLPGQDNLGLQFSGIAQKIEGSRFDLTTKYYKKRNKSLPKESEDMLRGRSWYQLKPKKIELIHEALFGFTKQVYEEGL